MSDLSDVIRILPTMKSWKELLSALEVLPEYDAAICDADTPVRLMSLSDLYRVYVPNQMSLEIYSKLYLALMRSLQKKGSVLMIQQQNQNFKAIMQQEYSGIMGGRCQTVCSSFEVIQGLFCGLWLFCAGWLVQCTPAGLGRSSASEGQRHAVLIEGEYQLCDFFLHDEIFLSLFCRNSNRGSDYSRSLSARRKSLPKGRLFHINEVK